MFGFDKSNPNPPKIEDVYNVGTDIVHTLNDMDDLVLIRTYAMTLARYSAMTMEAMGETLEELMVYLSTPRNDKDRKRDEIDAVLNTIERILYQRKVSVANVVGYTREMDELSEEDMEVIAYSYRLFRTHQR